MAFSSWEMARYNRHLKLPGFGMGAQEKLKKSRVLIIGAGGLGCPIGMYLAAAGVGFLGVVDHDRIEISNLQRQIAHRTEDAGKPKVHSLVEAMRSLNPEIEYRAYQRKVDAGWVRDLIRDYDLVIDGTDNYPTRYLVADACYFEKKSLIYGAIHQFDAQLSVFSPDKGPCYRCLFPQPPDPAQTPSCSDAGVLGVLPGTVGMMMATEALKALTGIGQTLTGSLALYSALDQSLRHIALARDPSCPLCGEQPVIHEVRELNPVCGDEPMVTEIEVKEAWALNRDGVRFIDVRDDLERQTCYVAGSVHLPLADLSGERTRDWPHDQTLVVYCHHGVRSRTAVARLNQLGFARAVSLKGGIDAWAREIDSEMPRY